MLCYAVGTRQSSTDSSSGAGDDRLGLGVRVRGRVVVEAVEETKWVRPVRWEVIGDNGQGDNGVVGVGVVGRYIRADRANNCLGCGRRAGAIRGGYIVGHANFPSGHMATGPGSPGEGLPVDVVKDKSGSEGAAVAAHRDIEIAK